MPGLARAQGEAATAEPPAAPAFRDVSAYPFRGTGRTLLDMQLLAQAMQLREYCADKRVADDFVRDRLTRFSRQSGREETCGTLLDY